MKKILVIGESCLDVYQYGSCVRLAPEAPVPIFKKNGNFYENGGMASNVYNNIKSISDADIKLITNSNFKDIRKVRLVDERTNYVVLRVDENDLDYKRKDIRMFDYSKFDAVVISDYNKGFLSKDEIYYISTNARVSFLDTKKILGPWASRISYIKINEFEYEENIEYITPELRDSLIITKGSAGADHKGINYPVEKVEIKDTCGAGDTFVAGLVVNFVETNNIREAITFANDCATKVVQRKGVSIV